jgi:hypothetical protein
MLSFSYLLGLALAIGQAQALYFYMDGTAPRCFYEDLPKDTLVLGMFSSAVCVLRDGPH